MDVTHDRTVHELFEAQVRRTPDATAVVFEGRGLSYAELDRRAETLARHLQGVGAGDGILVALHLERSLEMVVGILGILKSGAAYVPLDPVYPKARLAFMLEDTEAPVLLTQSHLIDSLAEQSAKRIQLDRFDWEGGGGAEPTRRSGVAAESLIYVIYTSGSTGRPKGVQITHRSVVNLVHWLQSEYPLTASDRWLQQSVISFDGSVSEIFWPIACGAVLVLAAPRRHRDSGYLVEIIQQERITHIQLVPTMLRALLSTPGVEKCRSLRAVLCVGEALPLALVEMFHQTLDADLLNLYGPTETTVYATHWRSSRDASSVFIGGPIANTQLYVLDEERQPVPAGAAGELYIAGEGLARGYHRRPDLTREAFVADPFSGIPGARMYRTGDLVCQHHHGNLEFLGRVDHQVKLRGFRIEPGEIEATLNQRDDVLESAVVMREYGPSDRRLVAFVTPAVVDRAPSENELREHIKQKLPEFMVPSSVVFLDNIPKTPSGKFDRRALQDKRVAEAPQPAVTDLPRSTTERAIARVWTEVLERHPIGIHENFFEIGGHSLIAMQIMNRINEELHTEMPYMCLFDNPTIAALAKLIP